MEVPAGGAETGSRVVPLEDTAQVVNGDLAPESTLTWKAIRGDNAFIYARVLTSFFLWSLASNLLEKGKPSGGPT